MSEIVEVKKNHNGAWISIILILGVFITIAVGANSQSSSSSSGAGDTSIATSNNVGTDSPTPPPAYISTDQVSLTSLQLNNFYNEVSGQVFNNSSYPVGNIEISIDAYDCPQSYYLASNCTQVGEDDKVDLFIQGDTFGSIPPNQEREVSGWVNLAGLPPIQGYFIWTYTIDKVFPKN